MRERTTWNREQIAKLAAGRKVADDPRAMNQDHLQQQPAADKYVTGDPSDFAEDVATPNWKAEYSGGEVKRNEIGMPEMRSETFSHPEKTAAEQQEEDDFLQKKADVCINLARRMLGKNASEQALEDQALAFMHMPDSAIVATATRLADQDDSQDQQSQEQKQAQQQDKDQQVQESEEQKQAAKKAQQQDDKDQQAQQDKEAGQIPENFKKKDDEGQGQGQQDKEAGQIPENFKKKDDEGDDDQKKQAKRAADMAMYSQQACDALMKGDTQAAQQAVQQMTQLQGQGQQPMMSQEQAQQQVQEMFSQAMGQPQQQPTMADDQLLDQMLQQPAQQQMMASGAPTSASAASMDIELQGASMDTGEVKLGSEDEALTALFASHSEVRDAAQAHEILTGVPHQASVPMTRTASTRTVGTRPTGGVAQLGGGTSGEAPSSDIDKLSGLWASAPDVRSVFGS